MPGRRLLVVEDDAAIRRGVRDALAFAGHAVEEAAHGDEGLKKALASACDLLLLDVVLPGRDGFSILKEVRRLRPELPVIMLTARGEEPDRVAGLQGGADDYVVKPFGVKELLARVEAVLRRSPGRSLTPAVIPLPDGQADLSKAEVRFRDGAAVNLSEKEVEVLRYLAGHPDRPVSREELLEQVWGLDPAGLATRTIDMHIARLREKLRDDPAEPRLLLTVRGKGYRFAGSAG